MSMPRSSCFSILLALLLACLVLVDTVSSAPVSSAWSRFRSSRGDKDENKKYYQRLQQEEHDADVIELTAPSSMVFVSQANYINYFKEALANNYNKFITHNKDAKGVLKVNSRLIETECFFRLQFDVQDGSLAVQLAKDSVNEWEDIWIAIRIDPGAHEGRVMWIGNAPISLAKILGMLEGVRQALLQIGGFSVVSMSDEAKKGCQGTHKMFYIPLTLLSLMKYGYSYYQKLDDFGVFYPQFFSRVTAQNGAATVTVDADQKQQACAPFVNANTWAGETITVACGHAVFNGKACAVPLNALAQSLDLAQGTSTLRQVFLAHNEAIKAKTATAAMCDHIGAFMNSLEEVLDFGKSMKSKPYYTLLVDMAQVTVTLDNNAVNGNNNKDAALKC